MRQVILLFSLFVFTNSIAQSDTLEQKLTQYRKLYESNLIDSLEYSNLKKSLLSINQPIEKKRSSRFEKKVILNVRLNPVFFFDIKSRYRYESGGTIYKSDALKSNYSGLHISLGPAINKRVHPNFSFGAEFNKERGVYNIAFPIYADVNYNILKKKYSPFIHGGLGYYGLLIHYKSKPQLPNNPNDPAFNNQNFYQGGMATAGIGINIHATKMFTVGASLDYRFTTTFNRVEKTSTQNPEGGIGYTYNYTFKNQLGVRLIFIFY